MKNKARSLLAATSLLVLAACGSGIEGKYTDKENVIEFNFKTSGVVEVMTMGIGREAKYTRDGDSIKIDFGNENIIVKLDQSGCIQYPMLGKLCKSK